MTTNTDLEALARELLAAMSRGDGKPMSSTWMIAFRDVNMTHANLRPLLEDYIRVKGENERLRSDLEDAKHEIINAHEM